MRLTKIEEHQKQLDETAPAETSLISCTPDRSFELTFQHRAGRIHCFIEDARTRKSGIGSGEYQYFVLHPENLISVGRWAQEIGDDK